MQQGNTDHFLLGTTYEQFNFKSRLGAGATSEVWKCEELGTKKTYAAKFVSRTRPLYSEITSYLKTEYDFYSQANHPCIPKVHKYFENVKGSFLIMDLFDGPNLQTAFSTQRPQYEPNLPEYVKKMFSVLSYVHKLKVVHCDIKPENFLVDTKGNLMLIDFSLLKKERFVLFNLLSRHKVEGTPEYMSPEQIKGKSITYASDFYSLGLVLYFMYTGKKAFEGENPSVVLGKNINDIPIEPIRIRPDICCHQMNHIIKKLIEKKARDRLTSFTELTLLYRKTKLLGNNEEEVVEKD